MGAPGEVGSALAGELQVLAATGEYEMLRAGFKAFLRVADRLPVLKARAFRQLPPSAVMDASLGPVAYY
jgi:hypothetical protein